MEAGNAKRAPSEILIIESPRGGFFFATLHRERLSEVRAQMRYSVMVKRGPFGSREEAATYAEGVVEFDPDTVQSVGIVPMSPLYDQYKQPSERREHGAWWLK